MKYYKLNHCQNSILNIEKTYPKTGVCNIGGYIKYEKCVNFDIAYKITDKFLYLNPSFRLRLNKNDQFYIAPYKKFSLPVYNLADKTKEEADNIIESWISEPFELYDSNLYDFRYIILPNNEEAQYLKMHHILGDFTCFQIYYRHHEKMFKSITQNIPYKAKKDMRYIEIMMNPTYKNYSEDLASNYFKNALSDFAPKSFINIKGSLKANRILFNINEADYEKIHSFCKDNKLKFISLFYAAMGIYLSQIMNINKIAIGTVTLNRQKDQLDMIGLFANTVPLIIDIDEHKSFAQICHCISTDLISLTRLGGYPLNKLIRDNNIEGKLFDITISYINKRLIQKLTTAQSKEYFNGYSHIPIQLFIEENRSEISYTIQYRSDLFCYEYINAFGNRIISLMLSAMNTNNIGEISVTDAYDLDIYQQLNNTKINIEPITISQMFNKTATSKPNDIAVIYDNEKLSYNCVKSMSNHICNIILENSIKKNDVVGIMTGRCKYTLPAMLGVMKSGAAYMPISPDTPKESLPKILNECATVLTLSKYETSNMICLDKINYENNVPENDFSSIDACAYCMKTSGSSGMPKTVCISHHSLYIRLLWMHNKYGIDGCILQKTPTTFDVSGWELLSPAFGGHIVILPDDFEKFPDKIIEYINKFNVDTIHFVPSMLKLFLYYIKKNNIKFASLKKVFASGESLTETIVNDFYSIIGYAKLYNLYGPTECTIDVTAYSCMGNEDKIPIGTPVYNTQIHIVNDKKQLMPIGEKGEILITGDLVGIGYKNSEVGGYTTFNGKKAYMTGDMGYVGFDSQIYCLGRNDTQIKVHGIRINLSESENYSLKIDGVIEAKAIVSNNKLMLFYTAESEIKNIRALLSNYIPSNRMPSFIIFVDKMPLTSSGKLDINALLKVDLIDDNYIPPETEKEKLLCSEILKELRNMGIHRDKLSVCENIFDAGLDSLSVISVTIPINDAGINLNFQDFYKYTTVRELANNSSKVEPITTLKKGNGKMALLCFPYSGGQPQSFALFAENVPENIDVLAVNYSYFDKKLSVEDISLFLLKYLDKYEKIQLAGCCIGSAFAVETAFLLEKNGKAAENVFLIASLPTKSIKIFGKTFNFWNFLANPLVNVMLRILSGKPIKLTKSMLKQFRIDTDRFFEYTKNEKQLRLKTNTCLAFASKDTFTKGYKKKYKNWQKYIGSRLCVYIYESNEHYFIESYPHLYSCMENKIFEKTGCR